MESGPSSAAASTARVLAFYLPQFHPIPENDRWWGRGFTEWTNVVRAKPLFRGHHQPQLPSDLGFYDLRVPEVRDTQADMARSSGISAFCYYHYWFDGRRLLNRPFDEVLASGRPDFPFCLCWANENWTRAWDGADREVLMPQRHSPEDDRAHIEHLLPAFQDSRYVRIHGKPLFLVYRTELLPDPARTAEIWRERASAAGIGDLYLARVENFVSDVDPKTIGFDAAVEFAPDWRVLPAPMFRRARWDLWAKMQYRLRLVPRVYLTHRIYPYEVLVRRMLAKPRAHYKRFRCVTPGWDNSPRRASNSFIFRDSTPELYESWLRAVIQDTSGTFQGEERLVFVNAWNEWAEGNHLEPDHFWGRAYLEATARAVESTGQARDGRGSRDT
ncbi:MAG: glycoside hydrolase family 99-like domain-containing protein [Candidatus Rokuibacteriota bacterium]